MTANPNYASQVRVGVRNRPQTSKETAEGGKAVVVGSAFDRTVSLSKRKFTYDSVFHSNVTQSDLYRSEAPVLLNGFLGGYNATILAYGQTGAGKTYTMGSEAGGTFVENLQGGGNLSDNDGLIPRFMSDMFATLVQRREASESALLQSRNDNNATTAQSSVSLIDFKVSTSFLEVYGEDIYDLSDGDRNALKIREDSNKEVIVVGLKSTAVANTMEAMNVLNMGTMNRTTAATLMNHTSSRSHAIFTVNLQQTTRSADGDEITTSSRFTFVDLAGSERMKKTGAEGARAKEGIKINEGLLALGNVINALADDDRLAKGEKVHVPYRQSKLTRLLQDALGGNSQTLFLACVSPSDTNASETLSTLHYANRARNIKNAPHKNVDATAEELRRLRTLTNLLKCELIKERFDGGSRATAADPEVEIAHKSVLNPSEIGVMDEDLLQRDDVVAYMKQIDEKVAEVSGSESNPAMSFPAHSSTFAPDQPMPQSVLDTASNLQITMPIESTSNVASSHNDDDEDDYSDVDAILDDDIQLIDELLDNQDEEQINKIEGDIKEQEERLLQIREHLKVYHDMKEKYANLMDVVEKLESEKQALAEKLENFNKDPSKGCSLSIKAKLEQVKTSLSRARQDVRKQQQKAREAEQEAQRCKGLERRIEEMKCAKTNLIRKQKDDAKKQQNASKTKAREIQMLRRNEKTAQKKVVKLEAECQRYKTSLERFKTRYEKLSDKLKQTETSLKQATSSRRSNSATGTRRKAESDMNGLGQFAPASNKLNSIKFVLDKTVSDRVALTKNGEIYSSKAADLKYLKQSMAKEVHVLNELKRESKNVEFEPSEEILVEIKELEDNVQEFLIQIELVENNLEELRARYPSIEECDVKEEAKSNVFEEHEPALKMISKFNGPTLRTLLLNMLGSCYTSELARKSMKDEVVRKDFELNTLEDEVRTQYEKINILSKSLQLHSKENTETLETELNDANSKLDACMAEKATLLIKLDGSGDALSVPQGQHESFEEELAKAIAETTEELSVSYAKEIEKLKSQLESDTSSQLQQVQEKAEEQRMSEVKRMSSEMTDCHAAEIEKVRSVTLEMLNDSQSKELEELTASHQEELARVRSDVELSVSQAIAQTTYHLSISHAQEMNKLKTQLEEETEEQHLSEVERISSEMIDCHAAEIMKVRSEVLELANTSQSKHLEQLTASHQEELARVRSKMEASVSQLITQTTEKLLTSHAQEIETLRSELEAQESSKLQRAQEEADKQRMSEVEQISLDMKDRHVAEIEKVRSEVLELANDSQSKQLEQLTSSHQEELLRVRSEMEESISQAITQTTDKSSTSHAQEIEKLRSDLESEASSKLQRVQEEADKQHMLEVERITNDLNDSHAAEIDQVKLASLSQAEQLENSQCIQLEQLTTSHQEELVRVRSEIKVSVSQAITQTTDKSSTSHAQELEKLRSELESEASSKLQRVQEDADEHHMLEVDCITNDLNESRAAEIDQVKLASLSQAEQLKNSQSIQLDQLTASHQEELARLHSEIEVSVSQAITQTTDKLLATHEQKLEKLRSELKSEASSKLQRVQEEADEKHSSEMDCITNDLNESRAADIDQVKLASSSQYEQLENSQSIQLDQLTASHQEELARMSSEMEVSIAQAITQTRDKLSTSHAQELEKLRSELESEASSKLQLVQEEDEKHVSEIERITNDLNESHAAEIDQVKLASSSLYEQLEKSQSIEVENLTASHQEELTRMHSEMDVSVSHANAQTTEQLSLAHAQELEKLRSELEAQASSTLQRVQEGAEKQHSFEIERITNDLNESLEVELASSPQSEQLEQLVASQKEEMDRMLNKMEVYTSQMLTQQKQMESMQEKMNFCSTMNDTLQREVVKTKEALSVSEQNLAKAADQMAEKLAEEKELESIEDVLNTSVSNKDALLRELEKTAMLKDLAESKAALTKSEEKNAETEAQLAALQSQRKRIESIEDQLQSSVSDNIALLQELKETKGELSVSNEKNAEAELQLAIVTGRNEALATNIKETTLRPQDVKESNFASPRKSKSLMINASGSTARASPDAGTPSSVRSSSSAILPNFAKFDNLKQKYRRKNRDSMKSNDK